MNKQTELKNLYTSLYGVTPRFGELMDGISFLNGQRSASLHERDALRLSDPMWYTRADMLGMMLYVDLFAGDLRGVTENLDYIRELGVSYLHLMPLLAMPAVENDGGYAVSDYRAVHAPLGTMDDLATLCAACHARGISICLDFVVNHTSSEHAWAKRAIAGEREYQDRYFCFDTDEIPNEYEKTVPQVFPATAPGSFTYFPAMGKYVMTSFYPYQWDLNYQNPVVLNEIIFDLLFLANQGIDVFRLDATPYIWKRLGTSCRNLPEVHTLVRIIRLACEIACPGVLLKGEVVMAPQEVAPYFGTSDAPECHLLYNVTGMVNIWNSMATKDARLLRGQLRQISALPHEDVFLNYVRCHDDIGWGLDEPAVAALGFNPYLHKQFLYEFYSGQFDGSWARGALYNYHPESGDARSCGTCASLCGVEAALDADDKYLLLASLSRHLMAHALILSQSGLPVLYSGDELAALNDYGYVYDPAKAADSRYIHRGRFDWANAARRNDPATVQGQVFTALRQLVQTRAAHICFDADAAVTVYEFPDPAVLWFSREKDRQRVDCLYNFSERYVNFPVGRARNLLTGREYYECVRLLPYDFVWLEYPR